WQCSPSSTALQFWQRRSGAGTGPTTAVPVLPVLSSLIAVPPLAAANIAGRRGLPPHESPRIPSRAPVAGNACQPAAGPAAGAQPDVLDGHEHRGHGAGRPLRADPPGGGGCGQRRLVG